MNESTYGTVSDDVISNVTDDIITNVTGGTTGTGLLPVFTRYSWTEFCKIHAPLAIHVDQWVTPIWYFIGIFGNICSAKVWMEKRMRHNNSSAVYLIALSISDLLALQLHIVQELQYAWGVNTLNYPVFCEAYFLIYLAPQYLSPLLVLGFTVERWIAICHPFSRERFCTAARAKKVVFGMILSTMALGSIQGYFWVYETSIKVCTVRGDLNNGEGSLYSIWTWIVEMLIFGVVPLVALFFNILVILEIKKITKMTQTIGPENGSIKSATSTMMLLAVSFYLIFTVLPCTIVFVLESTIKSGNDMLTDEQIRQDPTWQAFIMYVTSRKIIDEICLSHFACNIFLYCLTGKLFRNALFDDVRQLCLSSEEKSNYTEVNGGTVGRTSQMTKV
jgi:hypothetical protein